MLTNALYIISTPIGNLGDISPRAKGILQEADVIACEDTRVSKKLFSLLGLSLQKKFITYHDHNEEEKAQEITDIIAGGKAVALISDAGSPLISDPGYKLVRKCREQNVNVTAIPGACAVITALQLSGLPTNRFMFAGFIPNKEKAREDLFNELKNIDTTLIFYETAPRLIKTLEKGAEIFGNREIAVARELTKIHEETLTGSFSDIIASFSQTEPKGEFVVMIAPPDNKENIFSSEAVADLLREKMQSVSLKSAVKEVAQISGLNKNEVYDLALRIKMTSYKNGKLAEFMARIFMRLHGFSIITANFVTGRGKNAGEIDFIARKKRLIVFVEVKHRKTLDAAACSITEQQKKRIIRGAQSFLQKNPQFSGFDYRFDAVLVFPPFHVKHIKNAWTL